ncbi:hypothetical protein [Streptomyces justiciae]|uniref:hypothetical protein n=1 Tax=Streptomyces justiciae TaxID=2780140 RepID=UPI0021175E6E|nr:hypothetical protein [Streptomyces justiciae]MCW8383951.1 hypothetical protein [Streptomyces justiciae]
MPSYDATEALDDLFGDSESYSSDGGDAVGTRTEAILDGPAPAASIDAVLRLADGLPSLDDVQAVDEHDTSELTETELRQKEQTETVISTALAAGDAAVWVIAQGLERAAKGRWWRRTHTSLGSYVEAKIGRSAVYARQLRRNAPLALETAHRTGTVPKPSQVKVTSKTEEQYGRDAAVTLYEVVRDVSSELGTHPTADSLMAVHKSLPRQLPEGPEQQREVIVEATRRTLGVGTPPFESDSNESASIEAPPFESDSNSDASAETSSSDEEPTEASKSFGEAEDDIEDAEIVPEHLATLKDALRTLNAVNRAVTKGVFAQAAANPDDASEYAEVRQAIIAKTTAIRNKALHAPKV